eukprot:5196859-Prymnesium_polylepis.1
MPVISYRNPDTHLNGEPSLPCIAHFSRQVALTALLVQSQTTNRSHFDSKWPHTSKRAWRIPTRGVEYMVSALWHGVELVLAHERDESLRYDALVRLRPDVGVHAAKAGIYVSALTPKAWRIVAHRV